MKIEINGLEELIKEAEKLATPREIDEADKKALKRCGDLAKAQSSKQMPKSKDVTKSGRKGSRTYQHSADNIPMKVKKENGKFVVVVGWDKGDISPYYYTKFIEFGSSKMPPQAPFKKVFIKQRKEWDEVFREEYEKLVERLEK